MDPLTAAAIGAGAVAIGGLLFGKKKNNNEQNAREISAMREMFAQENERQRREQAIRDEQNAEHFRKMSLERDAIYSSMYDNITRGNNSVAQMQQVLSRPLEKVPSLKEQDDLLKSVIENKTNMQSNEEIFEKKNKDKEGHQATRYFFFKNEDEEKPTLKNKIFVAPLIRSS